ncbi:MAG TPA: hypothetical protein VKD22_01735 [Ramlibacter sp.]|nr:hypothetical protein [Ramlibacter sp.]
MSLNAIWFLGTGLAILLAAALNLLRIHYAALVPALGRLAAMTNCVLLLLDLAVALQVPLRRNPQILVLFVLLGFLTVTSLRRPYAAAPAR